MPEIAAIIDELNQIRSEQKEQFSEIRKEQKEQFSEIRSEQKEQLNQIQSEQKQIFEHIVKTEMRLNQGSEVMSSLTQRLIRVENNPVFSGQYHHILDFYLAWQSTIDSMIKEWTEKKKDMGKIKDQSITNVVKWIFDLVKLIAVSGIVYLITKYAGK